MKRYDFASANREHKKHITYIPAEDYFKLKQQYIKRFKDEELAKIEEMMKKYNFSNADSAFKKFKSYITEDEYLKLKQEYTKDYFKLKQQYIKSFKDEKLAEIEEMLKKYDFSNADSEFEKFKSYITEDEYLKLKQEYTEKHRDSIWQEIIVYLEHFDFTNADNLFNTSENLDSQEYLQLKKDYKLKQETWKIILQNLDAHRFKEADAIIEENLDYSKFFNQMKYEDIKISRIQDYFESSFQEGEDPFTLDLQQAAALGDVTVNTLVSARAGSGKTRVIVAKILYLLEIEQEPWDSVYVLAFNRNVPEEISDRIQQKITLHKSPKKYLRLDVAQTFHKLSREWSGYQGRVLAEDKKRFIKIIIEHLKDTNPEFGARVYSFFRKESMQVERKQFKDPHDYYLYIRNSQYRTLKGDTVKSVGEKWIADFLYEHGIDYYYEYSFYPSYISAEHIRESDDYIKRCLNFLNPYGETKPDFYLTKYNIVWEHWAIDENDDESNKHSFYQRFGTPWEEYKEKMVWKKGFWKLWRGVLSSEHWAIKSIREVRKLIETSVYDINCSREIFEEKLTTLLLSEKIQVYKRDNDELIEDVWARALDRFTILMESFINRFQQKFFDSRGTFVKVIENYRENDRVYEFLKLGLEVLDCYEKQLAQEQKTSKLKNFEQYKIDFNQLLLEAIKKVENGEADNDIQKMKCILVDEFQDFSELFFRLLQSIRNRNPDVRFFCVGDDWQAINRFAGSDTKYFNDFEKYFKPARIREISNNYRSTENIINKSNSFMLEGGFQGSPAKAFQVGNDSEIKVYYVDDVFIEQRMDKQAYQDDQVIVNQFISYGAKENDFIIKGKYLKKCYEIIKENPNKQVLILHRNNQIKYSLSLQAFFKKLCNVLLETKVFKSKEACQELISIKTMHTAKGLEADVVILLEINQGVIPMFHPDNELFEIFGEDIQINLDDQRRLFYVAITRAKKKLYILCEKDKKSDFLNNM